jgi:hypothetical protein
MDMQRYPGYPKCSVHGLAKCSVDILDECANFLHSLTILIAPIAF